MSAPESIVQLVDHFDRNKRQYMIARFNESETRGELINRFLIRRIAEDRGHLRDTLKGDRVWDRLRNFFSTADDKFNSELRREIEDIVADPGGE